MVVTEMCWFIKKVGTNTMQAVRVPLRLTNDRANPIQKASRHPSSINATSLWEWVISRKRKSRSSVMAKRANRLYTSMRGPDVSLPCHLIWKRFPSRPCWRLERREWAGTDTIASVASSRQATAQPW